MIRLGCLSSSWRSCRISLSAPDETAGVSSRGGRSALLFRRDCFSYMASNYGCFLLRLLHQVDYCFQLTPAFRTLARCPPESASGGKAEDMGSQRVFRLLDPQQTSATAQVSSPPT